MEPTATTLAFDQYTLSEELQVLRYEMQKADQLICQQNEVMNNLHQVQYILNQGPLTQATFEFLNANNELGKLVGSELIWDTEKSEELRTGCLEGIGSAIHNVWTHILAAVKWLMDKIKAFFRKIGSWLGLCKSKEEKLKEEIAATRRALDARKNAEAQHQANLKEIEHAHAEQEARDRANHEKDIATGKRIVETIRRSDAEILALETKDALRKERLADLDRAEAKERAWKAKLDAQKNATYSIPVTPESDYHQLISKIGEIKTEAVEIGKLSSYNVGYGDKFVKLTMRYNEDLRYPHGGSDTTSLENEIRIVMDNIAKYDQMNHNFLHKRNEVYNWFDSFTQVEKKPITTYDEVIHTYTYIERIADKVPASSVTFGPMLELHKINEQHLRDLWRWLDDEARKPAPVPNVSFKHVSHKQYSSTMMVLQAALSPVNAYHAYIVFGINMHDVLVRRLTSELAELRRAIQLED